MYKYEDKVFKDLPPFIPNIVKSYSSDKMTIFKAKNIFSEPKVFDSYKFHIVKQKIPSIILEKDRYVEKPNHVFPINPGEIHNYTQEGEVPEYMVFFIEDELVKRMAKLIYNDTNVNFITENFFLNSDLSNMISTFINESIIKQSGYEFILQSLNIQIVVSLLREGKHNITGSISDKKYLDKKLVKTVKEYFMEHYNENFTLRDIAKIVNYSTYHFIRIFKSNTGKTPFEYLLDIKVDKAKEMLVHTDRSVTDICYYCGFNNRTHFSTLFKNKVGVSPSQYRKLAK